MNTTILKNGWLFLPGLLLKEHVDEAVNLVRAAWGRESDESGVQVFYLSDRVQRLSDLMATGSVAQAVESALGPCEFLSVKPVVKDDAHAFATPWHQDHLYWGGCTKWSLWIALSAVGIEDGCLQIVSGSHLFESPHIGHEDGKGFSHRLPEPDPELVQDVVCRAGDAILFHDLLWHASRPIQPGRSRLALIPTYRSRGISDSSVAWKSSRALC